jgi:phosphoglycolate phosphatase
MRYRLVLWDFDGTLADTWSCGQQIYNEIAARRHFVPITDAEADRRMTTLEFLRAHRVALLQLPLLIREWHAALRARMDDVPLFPGVRDALMTLRRQGSFLGILSSNKHDNIARCLRSQEAYALFDAIHASSRLFGKANGIRRVLARQGLGKREVLYIGDETRDLDAARTAGIDSAAVGWGLNPLDVLSQSSPTYLIEQAAQIPLLNQ